MRARRTLVTKILVVGLVATTVRSGLTAPAQVLSEATSTPIFGGEPPKPRDIADGDSSVATQTGAFKYSLPIAVPPGRLGMQPSLALTYSSQAPLYGGIAAGWSLDLPEIRWDTSGGILAHRQGASHAPPFISTLAGGRRLVQVTEAAASDVVATYRAEDDSSYTRYERTSGGWRARTKDGITHFFNYSPTSDPRIKTEAGVTIATTPRRAILTRTEDSFGNAIDFYWLAHAPTGVAVDVQIDHIDYTSNAGVSLPAFARVQFDYTLDAECGGATSFRPGAKLELGNRRARWEGTRRLTAIRAGLLAGSTFTERRKYELTYDQAALACSGSRTTMRKLISIQESARSPTSVWSSKPAVTFD